jgi:hypothetical protein
MEKKRSGIAVRSGGQLKALSKIHSSKQYVPIVKTVSGKVTETNLRRNPNALDGMEVTLD